MLGNSRVVTIKGSEHIYMEQLSQRTTSLHKLRRGHVPDNLLGLSIGREMDVTNKEDD